MKSLLFLLATCASSLGLARGDVEQIHVAAVTPTLNANPSAAAITASPGTTTTGVDEAWCPFDIPTSTHNYCTECSTPTYGYAIAPTSCDSNAQYVRSATALNPAESAWLELRSNAVASAIPGYLFSAWGGKQQYPISYLMRDPPRIGLGFSGGGYRAMLGDAGALQAFDSTADGGVAGTAGLLDSSLYVSSLSGGAWAVGSWALNDYPPMPTLVSISTIGPIVLC
jgi:Lysophospholipase catalytic domain